MKKSTSTKVQIECEDKEFIERALGPDRNVFLQISEDNYVGRVIDTYATVFSACERRPPNFENYDAVIVMDREGRIPYYGMHSYCVERGFEVPNPERVFFLQTSGMPLLLEQALEEAVAKSESRLVQEAYRQNKTGQSWFTIEGDDFIKLERIRDKYPYEDPELFAQMEEHEGKNKELWMPCTILAAEFTRALNLPKEERFAVSKGAKSYGCGITQRVQQIPKDKLLGVSSYYAEARKRINTAPQKTPFHTTLENLTSSKSNPRLLLIDGSLCDGRQKASTAQFLRDVYGDYLDIDEYITTRVLDHRTEWPLIVHRNFLKIMPSNYLTPQGFEIRYGNGETGVRKSGFMKGDTIVSEREDQFVRDLRSVGNHLVKYVFSNAGNEKDLKDCLASDPNLVEHLKRIDATIRGP